MSNPLAIATVTAILQQLLTGGPLRLRCRRGHRDQCAAGRSGALARGRRQHFPLPGQPQRGVAERRPPHARADNSLLHRPQAALDLNYLLTFYGEDTTLDQQRLLGVTVRQLHAAPVLAVIRTQRATFASFLDTSNLADHIDLVRFTPVNYSLEELSKLWSVFLKTDYFLSVAYQASVMRIATDDTLPAPARRCSSPRCWPTPSAWPPSMPSRLSPLSCRPRRPRQYPFRQNLDPNDEVTFTTPGGPLRSSGRPTRNWRRSSDRQPPRRPARGREYGTADATGSGAVPSVVLSQSNAAAFILRPLSAALLRARLPGESPPWCRPWSVRNNRCFCF